MPAKSHRSDLLILAALGALVVGTLLLLASWGWIQARENDILGVRSSHSASAEGTMAWYLLLERLGYQVQRSERPLLHEALHEIDVLFLIDPIERLGKDEVMALEDWVRGGGVLVCANASRRVPWPLHRIGLRTEVRREPDGFWDEDRGQWPAAPDRLTHIAREGAGLPLARDVATLRMATRRTLGESEGPADADEGPVEVLLKDAERAFRNVEQPRIAARPIGRGRVILLADSSFLANSRIGKEDDAILAVNLVAYAAARARGDRVAVDEYHFGFGPHESGRSVMAAMLFTTGPGWAVLTLTAAGLLYLVYRGRRFGTRRAAAGAPRRSKLEYVHAVGSTYRAAGAHRLTLALIFRWFRRRAAERVGVPASAPVADVADRLARQTGRPAARYQRILGTCEQAVAGSQHVSAHQLTVLLNQLAEIESEIFHEHRAGH